MEFVSVYIYFAVLFIINAAAQAIIFLYNRKPFHLWTTGWLASCAYIFLYWYLLHANLLFEYPFLAGTYMDIQIFCSACGIFMVICIFQPNFRPTWHYLVVLLPGLLAIIRLLFLQFNPVFGNAYIKSQYVKNAVYVPSDFFSDLMFLIQIFTFIFVITGFLIRRLKWKNIWTNFRQGGIIQSIILYVLSILGIHITIMLPVLLIPFFPRLLAIQNQMTLVSAGESFIFTLFFQFMPLYIDARLQSIKAPEGYCRNFVRSRFDNMDLSAIENRIMELLEKEEVYLDENLTLRSFAQKTVYSYRVISEYINEYKKLRFNDLITQYRVKKVLETMKLQPHLNTTHIGFHSGFNSTSSFYRLFKKQMGVSPDQYRRDVFGQTG